MKHYRCVFNFIRGRTTMTVLAADAASALVEAQLTVKAPGAAIEVWDETGLVLERKSQDPFTGSKSAD